MMTTTAKGYRGDAYWQTETPKTADSGKVRASFFSQAGKLQIGQLFQDRETGEVRRGKGVTLDREDLLLHAEVRELILEVLAAWRE